MSKRLQNGVLISMTLGLVGLVCRVWLFAGGTDEKGLLVPGHPGGIVSCIIAAGAVIGFILMFRDAPRKAKYRKLFPASKAAAAGTAAAAVGICWSIVALWGQDLQRLGVACGVLGFVAGAALLLAAYARFRGARPNFLLSALVAMFLIIFLLSHYQSWSAEPEVQRYVFQLAALACLTLRFYLQAALDLKMGSVRALVTADLCAIPLCCLALPGSGDWVMYFGMVIFLSLSLSSMDLSKPRKKPVKEGE